VEKGELMAIIGNSGSGKSTLLNILGGLDRPSAGSLFVDGIDMLKLTHAQMKKYRKKTVGFMWQNSARNLIPYLSALENVELPMIVAGRLDRERALSLLDMTGMLHRRNSRLEELSGGEQQRVAMAIAVANSPKLLLADEPTGAIDTKTAGMVMDSFHELNRSLGVTIIIVTHDLQLAKKVNRVVAIRDGRTSSEFIRKSYKDELEHAAAEEAEEEKEELVVVDKSGRLQLPREFLDALGMTDKNKLKAELEDDHIILRRPEEQEH
jgi:ABC-type lipoprotein export system ATPase subunit